MLDIRRIGKSVGCRPWRVYQNARTTYGCDWENVHKFRSLKQFTIHMI